MIVLWESHFTVCIMRILWSLRKLVRLKQEKCSVVSVAVSNVEEREFSWQEKVFSPFEVSYYKSPGNCHSSLDEKYHQDVTELYQTGTSTNRLFTYTDNDDFASTEEDETVDTILTVSRSALCVYLELRHYHLQLWTSRAGEIHPVFASDATTKESHLPLVG
uniref:Uncharacterized protein n=1 Tax=Timema monikensis TaxID=170555 RepID=A0A7R9ECA4_9NEOP|nr:unnamed protein product [Timema monikensis]